MRKLSAMHAKKALVVSTEIITVAYKTVVAAASLYGVNIF